MKKITLVVLVMLAFCWQSNAQVTVGDGTYSSAFNTYPINPYYGYSYAQSIYLASEINASGDITSISFEMANADAIDNSDDLIDLWIGHTTKTEFDTTTDWVDVTTLTQVMTSGTLTKTGTTITFTFSSPFTYNGTDNLMIALDANEDSFEESSDVLIGTNVGSNRTLRQMSDTANADPLAPPTGVRTTYVGNITFNGITQTCPNPSALTATNITPSQADLAWTAGASETLWNIELGVAGFSPTGTPTTSGVANPYTAMSLTPATDYEYYVQADCTGGDVSGWVGPYAFTTGCVAFTPEYNADMSLNVPNCWEEASNGDIAGGPMDLGSGSWIASNHNGTPSNRINLYFTNHSDWIISPVFDLSTAAPSELNIYVALTESTTSGSGADLGSDDSVDLLMTTDGGTTWTSMQSWTQGNVPTDVGEQITYDLSAITGDVQFAFLGDEGDVNDPEDVYFHVSQFRVRETPSCIEPSALMVDNITATTADFSWTENGTATSWNIELGVAGFTPTGNPTATSATNPYGVMSLTEATAYEFYIQADCGASQSVWVGPMSFSTACNSTAVPYTEDFETGAGCGSVVNEGAGNSWGIIAATSYGFAPNHLRYAWNTANPADTWFFTQGINLTAGEDYTVSYDYGGTGATFPEKLKVSYGTSPSAAAMTTDLADYTSVTNDTPTTDMQTFTAPSTGVYYFGFQAYSDANQFYLHLDNISVDVALSTNEFDNPAAFTFYPNPVKNTLILNAQNTIEQVAMYNILGQEVLRATPNTIDSELDMSNLQSGTYFVKVTIANVTKAVRVIKQ